MDQEGIDLRSVFFNNAITLQSLAYDILKVYSEPDETLTDSKVARGKRNWRHSNKKEIFSLTHCNIIGAFLCVIDDAYAWDDYINTHHVCTSYQAEESAHSPIAIMEYCVQEMAPHVTCSENDFDINLPDWLEEPSEVWTYLDTILFEDKSVWIDVKKKYVTRKRIFADIEGYEDKEIIEWELRKQPKIDTFFNPLQEK